MHYALNWSKVTVKKCIILLKISNKCTFWTFYSSVNPEKLCIPVSTKTLSGTTVLSINNNQKCSKSAYYDFWRSCDTEDWSNDAENTAAHHRNN